MAKKYTVVYHRYQQQYEIEFDTQEEAIQWTLDQEYAGNISYDKIIDPEGIVLDDHSELGYDSLIELGAKEG